MFNGQSTRYLTESKCCSFFAYALVDGLLMLRVIHVSVFIIAVYTKTMFK